MSVVLVLCICVIVAMEELGLMLLATLMLEIHPAETPMTTTSLLQTTTVITYHMPLRPRMMTWYGSNLFIYFSFRNRSVNVYEFNFFPWRQRALGILWYTA